MPTKHSTIKRLRSRSTLLASAMLCTGLGSRAGAADTAAAFAAAWSEYLRGTAGDASAAGRAEEQFRQLVTEEPSNPVFLAYHGSTLTLKGRDALAPWSRMKLCDEGLAAIDRALKMLTLAHDRTALRGVPMSSETRLVAATTFLQMPAQFGRTEDARPVLEEALASPALTSTPAPIRARLLFQNAVLARKQKREADEITALQGVLALGSEGQVAAEAQARLEELGR